MAATLPFREALNKGIVSGTFVDTKIILFSRRDPSGRVYGPKTLYASSHVLKSVPYFNDRESLVLHPSSYPDDAVLPVLFGNFLEAGSQEFGDNVDDDEFAEEYGYHSDSDLEEDETVVGALKGILRKASLSKGDMKGVLKKATPPKEEGTKGVSRKVSLQKGGVKGVVEKATPRKGTLEGVLRTSSLRRLRSGITRMPPHEKYAEQANKGKVVKVPDMAFIT